jgi:glucokinase
MKACIDVGGTKVAVSLNTGAGLELVGRRSEPTAKTGGNDAVARQIIRLVDEACAALGIAPHTVQRAGVSSTGPFVLRGGLVELATPNICGGLAGPARGLPNDWPTATLEAPLRQRFTGGVRVENDAVAALEAERRWGALQGVDHCAYVTWSTGVGMGLCVDGRVLRGKNGNAGHGGHMFASDDDRALCGCGNIGDLEALVGGNSLPRRFGADAATLLQRARAGDAAAAAIVDELCRVMGRALYNITVILDLQRIALGGSVFSHHQDHLLPRLQAQVRGRLPALTEGCELVAAGLGERVGDYAALALLV